MDFGKVALGKTINILNTLGLTLDTDISLFDGEFIKKNIIGSNPSMTVRSVDTAQMAKISVSPNTTYTAIKQPSSRFKIATDTIVDRSDDTVLQGGVMWSSSSPTTELYHTFTTGSSDVVAYIDVSAANEIPLMQIVAGTKTALTISDYPTKINGSVSIGSIVDKNLYIDAKATEIMFYIRTTKSSNIYLGYNFKRTTIPYSDGGLTQNCDVWRLVNITEYILLSGIFAANKAYSYLTDGEIECAIKVTGTNDFSGGFHGYEIIENGFYLVDGIYKTLGTAYSGWCKQITFCQNSNILKNGTESDIIAHHSKIVNVGKNGITIKQTIKWLQALSIASNYMGMFPVKRKSNYTTGDQITDHFFSDYDYIAYDVTETAHANDTQRVGVSKAIIWSGACGLTAEIEVIQTDNGKGSYFFCSNSDTYNKLYFSHTNEAYTTSIDEVWDNVTTLKVDLL